MPETVIRPEQLGSELRRVMTLFVDESMEFGAAIMREMMVNMFGSVIEESPVGDFDPAHEGTFKGSWRLTIDRPSKSLTWRRDPRRTRDSLLPRLMTAKTEDIMRRRWYLTNNRPEADMLEHGGYPKTVKKGTWNKKTKRYQIRSSGGFSKQAPNGMVRRNISKMDKFLDLAARKVVQ